MHSDRDLYIGLISGTSADGIDCALVDFSNSPSSPLKLVHTLSHPLPKDLRQEILELMVPTTNEIDRLGVADQLMGEELAKAVQHLLSQAKISADQIKAIGNHGQTLRHRPPGELQRAYTLQIGDPNIIAEQTGITTVGDIRRRDMAAGGQGAPLAPIIHRELFSPASGDRIIINTGGIANITHLKADGSLIGFDTGPANCLMDGWILRHQQKPFDQNGDWAATGKVNGELLTALLSHPYFALEGPKSTGREMFTMNWLDTILGSFNSVKTEDVQATLLKLTSKSIAQHILDLQLESGSDIYVCGGGAHNAALMQQLQQQLSPFSVASTEKIGLSPDWVEACAFAWMAKQTLDHQPSNLPSVTGANRAVILGGIYLGNS